MSHHLDTPLARQNGQLYIDDLCVFSTLGEHRVRHGRELDDHRAARAAGLPP